MPDTAQALREDVVDLRAVLKIMAERKLVIIAGTLLALAAGVVLAFFILEPQYEARVLLRVNNPSPGTDSRARDNDFEGVVGTLSYLPRMSMETHVGQLKSDAMLEQVSAKIDFPGIKKTFEAMDVTTVSGSNLISLAVRCGDPVLAAHMANTIAEQYIHFISGISKKEVERSIEYLQALQSLTNNELLLTLTELNEVRAGEDVEQPETQARIEYLEAEVFYLRQTADQLAERILETRVAGAINYGETSVVIVSGAAAAGSPVGPNKALYLAVSLILGLFVSVPLAFVIEHLDDKIRTGEDIEEHSGLTVLGELPLAAGDKALLLNHTPGSVLAEAYRYFRTNLSYVAPGDRCRVLLVTSPGASDGKSTVAANLAVVLAQAGNKVLLVDCDLRKPSLHSYFGLDNTHGLTDLLLEGGEAVDYVYAAAANEGLFILTSGPAPPNPAEMILLNETKHFWRRQAERFDYVLVDSPPVMAVTDTVLLSSQVDGVILTLAAGVTGVKSLQQVKAKLARVNANLLGAVLNQVKVPKSAYYYYQ